MSYNNGQFPQFYQAGATSSMAASGIYRWGYFYEKINVKGMMMHGDAGTIPGSENYHSFQIYKNLSQISLTPTTLIVGYAIAQNIASGSNGCVLIGPNAGVNLRNASMITAVGNTCGDNLLYGVSNTAYGENAIGYIGSQGTPPAVRTAACMFSQSGAPATAHPMLVDPQSPTSVTPAVDSRISNLLITGDITAATLYTAADLDRSRTLVGTTSLQRVGGVAGPYSQTANGMNTAVGSDCLQSLEVYSQFNTGCGGEAGALLQWGDNNTLVGMRSAGSANMMRCSTIVGTSAAVNMAMFDPTDVNRFPVAATPKNPRIDFYDVAEEVSYNTVIGCRAADRAALNPAAYSRANPEPSVLNARNNVLIGHGVCSAFVYTGTNTFTGPYNVIAGSHAAPVITTGRENIIQGFYTAPRLTTGNENVIIGSSTPSWAVVDDPFGEYAVPRFVFDPAVNPTLTNSTAPALTTGSDNVIIGKNAGGLLATGTENVAIGHSAGTATAAATNTISIGTAAAANTNNSIAIGNTASVAAVSNSSVAVGNNARVDTGNDGVAVGNGSHSGATGAVSLGLDATALGTRSVAIGDTAVSSHTNSVALGMFSSTIQANECVIGNGLKIRETAVGSSKFMSVQNWVGVYQLTYGNVNDGIFVGTAGGAVTLTTPTAANLELCNPGAPPGTSLMLKVIVLDANTYTLTAGDANVTLIGNTALLGPSSYNLIFRKTGDAPVTFSVYV